MQRLFLLGMAAVVILAIGFVTIIVVSILPYFSLIGKVATGVVIVLLCCLAALMASFTWSRIGIWQHRRRTIVAGDIVVYVRSDGEMAHLSAMHEQAKVPVTIQAEKALPAPKKPEVDSETLSELFEKGISLRNIAESTGLKYYQVQKAYQSWRSQQ